MGFPVARTIDATDGPEPTRQTQRDGQLTIAKAIDSTGLHVTSNNWAEPDDTPQFLPEVVPNATWVDIWLAYVPARTMEFTALPHRVGHASVRLIKSLGGAW